jgi:hypothetical protein
VLRIKEPRQFLFIRFIALDIMAISAGVSYIPRIISFCRFPRREIKSQGIFSKINPSQPRKKTRRQVSKQVSTKAGPALERAAIKKKSMDQRVNDFLNATHALGVFPAAPPSLFASTLDPDSSLSSLASALQCDIPSVDVACHSHTDFPS